jgi:RNA polymerase sigma-70 factor, ECF subfamily
VNHPTHHGVWYLYRSNIKMQELVLILPRGRSLAQVAAPSRTSPDTAAGSAQAHAAGEAEANSAAGQAAFEALLATCGPLAFRVARGVLRNTADAEDVAQEALLRAFRRFHHLREPERFRGWLVRIAFRLALDRARSAKRRELRETLWSQPERRPPQATAEDLAVRNQFQQRLDRAMEELPEKLRLVLLLSAMQGHTLEEVSVLVGVPVGTVKSRLFLARKKLAEKLRCPANTTKRS